MLKHKGLFSTFILWLLCVSELVATGGVLILDTKYNGYDLRSYVTTTLLNSSLRTVRWTGAASDDGFLIVDVAGAQAAGYRLRNDSGVILTKGYIVVRSGYSVQKGTAFPVKATSAWHMLRMLDSNEDSRITAADAIWPHLRVFFDDDGDGELEASEVHEPLLIFEVMNIGQFGADRFDESGNMLQDGNYKTPAGFDRVVAEVFLAEAPVQPDPENGPWSANHISLASTSEAELMVRVGDIDNFGFGWPLEFNPFTGKDTPVHAFPFQPASNDAEGTDRIMVVTSFVGNPPNGQDGYVNSTLPPANRVRPIVLEYDVIGIEITNAVIQLFVDDFQAPLWHANYTITINGERAEFLERTINNLQQTGPIGRLITARLPGELLSHVRSGKLELIIDDRTTGAGEGYAIDFVKLLINAKDLVQVGTIRGKITNLQGEALEHAAVQINGVQVTTDAAGEFGLQGVASGIVSIEASHAGYQSRLELVNLEAGTQGQVNLQLQPVASADLGLEVRAPNKVAVGELFHYSITVTNAGPDAATDLVVSIVLPPDLLPINATTSRGTISRTEQIFKALVPSLEAKGTIDIVVSVRPSGPFAYSTLTTVSATEFDSRLVDNSISVETIANPVLNAPPQVALIQIENGQQVDGCGGLLLQANATDLDGSVAKVEFFSGTTKLGTATAAPFQFVWSEMLNGVHHLSAIATDDKGATSVSAPVQITVTGPTLHHVDAAALTSGNFSFCVGVEAGKNYELQGSVDLQTWVRIEGFTSTGNSRAFSETAIAPNDGGWKFYRAVQRD